jgi:small subunit ribosomal protein S16
MAVAIRLARHGSKKRPFYRVVATEKSSPRDGRFIELLGTYDPRAKLVRLNQERYQYWLQHGAKASETVASLARRLVRESPPPAEPVSAEATV